MKSLFNRLYAWSHTPLGDLIACIVLGIPLGLAMAVVTVLVICILGN